MSLLIDISISINKVHDGWLLQRKYINKANTIFKKSTTQDSEAACVTT